MKFVIAMLGALLLSITLLGSDEKNIHSREGFMPPFEGWRIVKKEPLVRVKKRFWRDEGVKNGVFRELKSERGEVGWLAMVHGVIVAKSVEVSKGHTHMAILGEDRQWIFGESGTFSVAVTKKGFMFRLEDFFTKQPAYGIELAID